jgi:hypothetical protein
MSSIGKPDWLKLYESEGRHRLTLEASSVSCRGHADTETRSALRVLFTAEGIETSRSISKHLNGSATRNAGLAEHRSTLCIARAAAPAQSGASRTSLLSGSSVAGPALSHRRLTWRAHSRGGATDLGPVWSRPCAR